MALAPKPVRTPRFLTVKDAFHLTPHMIRVTFSGPELEGFPVGQEGANCKLVLPEAGQSLEAFQAQLQAGAPRPPTRTYTVRHYRPETTELDIDFVDHGDAGPASAWARRAKAGDFLGFFGPGPVKVTSFYADYYVLGADLSALPVVAATLERMPADAKGLAVFEVTSLADRQELVAPVGIEQIWIETPDAHSPSLAQVEALSARDWPEGKIQTCIAGETSTIRAFKQLFEVEKGLDRKDLYLSGYWKIGLVEDAHQAMKRKEAQGG